MLVRVLCVTSDRQAPKAHPLELQDRLEYEKAHCEGICQEPLVELIAMRSLMGRNHATLQAWGSSTDTERKNKVQVLGDPNAGLEEFAVARKVSSLPRHFTQTQATCSQLNHANFRRLLVKAGISWGLC